MNSISLLPRINNPKIGMASFRILFGLDIYFEHKELSRRFKSGKDIMKQKYRAHIEYVKVSEFDLVYDFGFTYNLI